MDRLRSPVQEAVLAIMRRHGRILFREAPSVWSYPAAPRHWSTARRRDMPSWHTTDSTISALARRGLVHVVSYDRGHPCVVMLPPEDRP